MLPFEDMYRLIVTTLCLIIVVIIVIVLRKMWNKIDRLEKKLFPFLKKLDDKNYRLWKAKVRLEEELKERRKKDQLKRVKRFK